MRWLRAGGSGYPYDLYKAAGIDMASPAPYRALAARMNRLMDEIEALQGTNNAGSPQLRLKMPITRETQ